jgi:hypothetical protein
MLADDPDELPLPIISIRVSKARSWEWASLTVIDSFLARREVTTGLNSISRLVRMYVRSSSSSIGFLAATISSPSVRILPT